MTLLDDWLELDLGDRIDRINHPAAPHPHDDLAFMLEGYTQRLGRKSWTTQCVVEPGETWQVGEYQDSDASGDVYRYDGESSTTSGSFVTGTGTSLTVVTSAGPLWTTNPPGGFPILIRVAGAVLSVTNITGSASPQTFTVSTTVPNGVVKTIPSGSQVRVFRPAIYAL